MIGTNNLDELAEDQGAVLEKVKEKVRSMDRSRMKKALADYGNVSTQKLLSPLLS